MTKTSTKDELSQKESQLDKFKQAACELETDDDEARWDERLKKMAKGKPDGPTKG